MARDTSGPKNEPRYDTLGAPADAADLTELGGYAALVGNRKVLTAAQRTALTGNDRWVGLVVYESDTTITYRYTAGGWVRVPFIAGVATYNPAGIGVVISATQTAISGFSISAMPVGIPVLVEVEVLAMNAGSGAQRFVDIQPYNGTTAVDKLRRFSLPYPSVGGHMFRVGTSFEITPTAPDWSLRVSADQAASVQIEQAVMKVTVRP